jgi:YegS/Rv2252/BmrU family lipid kinase
LVLLNYRARQGALEPERLRRLFIERGGTAHVHVPEHPQQAQALIRRHAPGCRAVAVGGGDGSINAALDAVMELGMPLGVLPLGTANDLARTLSIPADLAAAVDVVLGGRLRAVDVGVVNGIPFMNAAHVGLGSRVTAALERGAKSRWGVLAYVGAVWKALRGIRPFRAEVVTPAARLDLHTIEVAVGNGPHYGGGMTMQNAAIDDHLLHVYSLRPMRVRDLVGVTVRLRRGTYAEHEKVDVLAADRLEVQTSRPRWVTVDGERRTRTPARFHVLRSALQVLVPPALGEEVR